MGKSKEQNKLILQIVRFKYHHKYQTLGVEMGILRNSAIASAAAATVLVSGSFPTINNKEINICESNPGYIISTQEMRSKSVAGTYEIEKMHAISFNDKNTIIHETTDRGDMGGASMQLNAYLKGIVRDGKPRYYWIQDTVHFIYSKGSQEQYLSSEVFREDSKRLLNLSISNVEGKGRIYSASDNGSGSATYIYDGPSMHLVIPQAGYLEMDETLKRGRITVNVRYQNDNTKEAEVYDRITIGRENEFKDAYFFSNRLFDAEMGFGGDNNGALGYFSDTNMYIGLYYRKSGSYVQMKYGAYHDLSTSESALDLSCIYRQSGVVQLYAYNY